MAIKQVAIAIDQLVNTLVGGFADETLSAHAYRCREKPIARVAKAVINGLFFWEHDHCYESYFAELNRKHLPRSYTAR